MDSQKIEIKSENVIDILIEGFPDLYVEDLQQRKKALGRIRKLLKLFPENYGALIGLIAKALGENKFGIEVLELIIDYPNLYDSIKQRLERQYEDEYLEIINSNIIIRIADAFELNDFTNRDYEDKLNFLAYQLINEVGSVREVASILVLQKEEYHDVTLNIYNLLTETVLLSDNVEEISVEKIVELLKDSLQFTSEKFREYIDIVYSPFFEKIIRVSTRLIETIIISESYIDNEKLKFFWKCVNNFPGILHNPKTGRFSKEHIIIGDSRTDNVMINAGTSLFNSLLALSKVVNKANAEFIKRLDGGRPNNQTPIFTDLYDISKSVGGTDDTEQAEATTATFDSTQLMQQVDQSKVDTQEKSGEARMTKLRNQINDAVNDMGLTLETRDKVYELIIKAEVNSELFKEKKVDVIYFAKKWAYQLVGFVQLFEYSLDSIEGIELSVDKLDPTYNITPNPVIDIRLDADNNLKFNYNGDIKEFLPLDTLRLAFEDGEAGILELIVNFRKPVNISEINQPSIGRVKFSRNLDKRNIPAILVLELTGIARTDQSDIMPITIASGYTEFRRAIEKAIFSETDEETAKDAVWEQALKAIDAIGSKTDDIFDLLNNLENNGTN